MQLWKGFQCNLVQFVSSSFCLQFFCNIYLHAFLLLVLLLYSVSFVRGLLSCFKAFCLFFFSLHFYFYFTLFLSAFRFWSFIYKFLFFLFSASFRPLHSFEDLLLLFSDIAGFQRLFSFLSFSLSLLILLLHSVPRMMSIVSMLRLRGA